MTAEKEPGQKQRQLFREKLHRLWQQAKAGRTERLDQRDRQLVRILLDHQEYGPHFENREILDGREYEAGATFNPFLHISSHQMVEDQLTAGSPAETVRFCQSLETRGLSRHEAIHYVILILLHCLYASAATGGPFDAGRYKRLLEACQGVDPSHIEAIIAEDLAANPDPRDLH